MIILCVASQFPIISLPWRLLARIVLKDSEAFRPTATKWRFKAIKGLVFKCLVEVKCAMVKSCIINQWGSCFCWGKIK